MCCRFLDSVSNYSLTWRDIKKIRSDYIKKLPRETYSKESSRNPQMISKENFYEARNPVQPYSHKTEPDILHEES